MNSSICISFLLFLTYLEARIQSYGSYPVAPPTYYRGGYPGPSYSGYNPYYRQPVYQPQPYYYYRQPAYNYYQYPQYSAYNRYPSYAGYYSQPAATNFYSFGRKSGHSDRYGGNLGYSYGCLGGPCKVGIFG